VLRTGRSVPCCHGWSFTGRSVDAYCGRSAALVCHPFGMRSRTSRGKSTSWPFGIHGLFMGAAQCRRRIHRRPGYLPIGFSVGRRSSRATSGPDGPPARLDVN
jgi:hypothetical protein